MIQFERPHLAVGASTHPGLSGKTNEDRFAVAAFRNAADVPVVFAVVADGIGGHQAGEVAAQLTVETMLQQVAASSGAEPLHTMESAIQMASASISTQSSAHANRAGMGSTCACVWVEGDRLFTAHVGDSRIYLIRDGGIQRTTVDHSWIQEAIDKGVVAPEQAHHHPNAHVLRRHLGSPEPPEVDLRLRLNGSRDDEQARQNQGVQLRAGEFVLLCTDGLTDMVEDPEILALIRGRRELERAAQDLVQRANEHGGRDNTTVVLIGVPQPRPVVAGVKTALQRVLGVRA